jgi:hypothetical protein
VAALTRSLVISIGAEDVAISSKKNDLINVACEIRNRRGPVGKSDRLGPGRREAPGRHPEFAVGLSRFSRFLIRSLKDRRVVVGESRQSNIHCAHNCIDALFGD